jgi:peptidoglycan hydrolase-like protein with peptidoglycan-binding domain
MSTQFYTQDTYTPDQPATSQPTGHRAPRPNGNGPSWYRIWAIVIGTAVAAALVVLATVGLTHNHATTNPAPTASTSAPAANPAQPTTPAQTVNPAQPTTPAVTPSASVKKLQQQLGQLNYYEGPVDGIMGPQTTAAIKDLQRQAGLPQTGTMNTATQAALANYLAHGNNQMGGNS